MAWRLAESLATLRKQVNAMAPNRSKVNDGTIGDAAHSARSSDHNPDTDSVVKAMDITNDPKNGCDANQIAEALRAAKDFRVKYIIWNRRICSSTESPWQWRKYSGKNPHDHHVHVSVKKAKSFFDSEAAWPIAPGVKVPDAPPMPKKVVVLRRKAKGKDVEKLQTLLGIDADGKFGAITEQAVKAFQKKAKLMADGIVGFYTWKELEKGK